MTKFRNSCCKKLNLLQEIRLDFSSPDLAHEFWSEIEIGGQHVLRNALYKLWEVAVEMVVSFFGSHGEKILDSHLRGPK